MKQLSALLISLTFLLSFAAGAETLSLQLNNASATQVAQITSTLERRFDNIKPGILSFVDANANEQTIHLQFTNWFPSNAQIDYLISNNGLFSLTIDGEVQPLITDIDIENAQTVNRGGQTEIALLLTEAAGQQLYARTSRLIGKITTLSWNGRVLGKLRITEPFGKAFAFPAPTGEDPHLISAVLHAGRLPENIQISRLPDTAAN